MTPTTGAYAVPPFPSRILLLLLGYALLAIWGCRGGMSGPTAEVVDSAGIEIVTSPGADRPASLVLEPVRRLGGEEDGPEAFYQVGRTGVGTDAAGRLYVLDRSRHRVLAFDSTGVHLRSMAGEGEGPGELSFPRGLSVEADGTVHVHDLGRRELVSFGPDGMILDGPARPEGFQGGMVHIRGSYATYLARELTDGGERLVRTPLEGPGDTTVFASVPPREMSPVELESCGMAFSGMRPVFTPSIVWDAWRDRMVAAAGTGYVVEVIDEGRLVRSVRRRIDPPTGTRALAVAEIGEGMTVVTPNGERVCDPEEVVEQRGFEETVPLVDGLRLAPDGGLWVRRRRPAGEESFVDLFGPEGVYLGTLPPDTPLPVSFLPDGRPLWVEADDFDVERLVIGRLVERDAAPTREGRGETL